MRYVEQQAISALKERQPIVSGHVIARMEREDSSLLGCLGCGISRRIEAMYPDEAVAMIEAHFYGELIEADCTEEYALRARRGDGHEVNVTFDMPVSLRSIDATIIASK